MKTKRIAWNKGKPFLARERNPFYGKKHTKETTEHLSKIRKGKHFSPKTQFKKGQTWEERFGEEKAKEMKKEQGMRAKKNLTGRKFSEKHKNSLKKIRKGKTWEQIFGKHISEKLKKQKSVLNEGVGNPNWRGGISFLPYGKGFTLAMKRKIFKRDNSTCQLCGDEIEVQLKNKFLCVHHIDYDKDNNEEHNLIALCNFCNSSVNFRREEWTNHFRKKLLNNQLTS